MATWIMVAMVTVMAGHVPVSGLFNMTILHTNDFHARYHENNKFSSPCSASDAGSGKCFGGTARLMSKVLEMRRLHPDSLFLDAGDQFQGTIWFSKFRSNLTAQHMGWLGYDAMALGNHEFDLGVGETVNFLQRVGFPVLSSNIDFSLEPSIAGLFNKSVVLTVGGQRIGIIGYTTKDTVEISKPGNLKFQDEVTQVQAEVNRLQAIGVNKIIALGHAGFSVDVRIAEQVTGVDVVVGGHTNTFLYTGTAPSNEAAEGDYPKVVVQPGGSRVLCVQDYAFGKYLGVLHLSFDDQGNVVSWGGNPVLLNSSVPQNDTILARLEPYSRAVDALRNTTVGRTHVFLRGVDDCRVQECNLGNVIADAMVKQNIKHSDTLEWNHVAMAFLNGGGVRTSIEKGAITLEDIMTVQPFQNTVDIVVVTGDTLRKVFEHCASKWTLGTDKYGGFLQVSGMRVTYEMSKPVGQRVRELLVTCTNCSYPRLEPVQASTIYKVIVPNYIATGGDGYSVLKNNLIKHEIIGDLDTDILMEYIEAETPLVTGEEGRIVLAAPVQEHSCVNAAFDWRAPTTLTPVTFTWALLTLMTLILG